MGNLLSHVQFLDFSEALGFQIEEIIPALDNYSTQTPPGGEITLGNSTLRMVGGFAAGLPAILERRIYYCRKILTWDKKNILEFLAYFERASAPDSEILVRRGNIDPVSLGFGFVTKNDGLYGQTGDGLASTELKLLDEGPGGWSDELVCKATLIPGARVEFYINGIYIGQITTNLPSGFDGDLYVFTVSVGPGGVAQHIFETSGFRFYQGE